MKASTVTEAVASRKSIRAFLDKPVSLEVLERVLDKARMTPSGCNFQPWEATVLTGAPLKQLQRKIEAASPQNPNEYHIQPPDVTPEYTSRLQEITASRFEATGTDRHDNHARTVELKRNITSFGAPALLVCYFPRFMGPPQWSDVGMWLQTIMLLLREEGLDSCAQEYMSLHARLIKEHIGVSDESHLLFCGMAIGFSDPEEPINNYHRPRVPLNEQVKFLGF